MITSRNRALGLCLTNSFLGLLNFGQVMNISRGHEESSGLERFADKGIRSQVGPFSKETEHSCKGWVLFADCQAVNCCDSQLVLLPSIKRCVVGCSPFSLNPRNFKAFCASCWVAKTHWPYRNIVLRKTSHRSAKITP